MEHLWSLPSVSLQLGYVSLLKFCYERSVCCRPQQGDRCLVDHGVGIGKVAVVVGEGRAVVALLGCQAYQSRAVEVHLIIMYKVRVLVLVHSAGREIDYLAVLVDMLNGPHTPVARGNLPDCRA